MRNTTAPNGHDRLRHLLATFDTSLKLNNVSLIAVLIFQLGSGETFKVLISLTITCKDFRDTLVARTINDEIAPVPNNATLMT